MRIIAAITAVTLLFAPLATASAADVSKDSISEILTSQGYNVRDYDATKIMVDVAEYRIVVAIDGADRDISFITWIPGVQASDVGYQFLNKFNNEVKFGRAYIDRDGDVAIQMDRNSSGGVSAKNIESDFDVFLLLINKFLSDLESQAVA
ncbi:MAG: YbjN domain-containing protein [Pseudomonadota bacterium]